MEKKRKSFKSGNFKKNNRWSGFQKTVHSEESKPTNSNLKISVHLTKQIIITMKNKNSMEKSKFGKRIYRSKI